MKFYLSILMVIAGAPVFAGAFSTLPGDSITSNKTDSLDISGLFSVFSDSTDNKTSKSPVVTFPDGSQYKPTDTGSILDILIGSRSKKKGEKKSKRKEASSDNVLNYMTKAYADHGFYQSGHWDDAEDWTSITRNITLPDYNPADFYRPVRGRVTSLYGFRPSFGRMHKGIDLSLNIGDTVRAALPGVVAKVAYDPGGYGHYVVLVHNNGMETRYAHLQAPIATTGAMLSAGDPLGLGGNSGNSTGPHLHFEIRYRGTAIDPSSLFIF